MPARRLAQTTGARLLAFTMCTLALLLLFFSIVKLFIGPLFVALFLSYLINPLINRFEAYGFKRTPLALSILFFFLILATLSFWFVLPVIITQFQIFFKILPGAIENFEQNWLPRVKVWMEQYFEGASLPFNYVRVTDFLPLDDFKPLDFLMSGVGAGTQLIGSLALFVIATPVFAFFSMRYFRQAVDMAQTLVPSDLKAAVYDFASDVDYTVRSVLSGQILVVFLLSVLYSTTFYLVGLPGGLAVGILTGISRIVPYLDIIVGGSLSFLIMVSYGSPFGVVIGVILGFFVIQLLDGLFLTPRIVGQFAGLHPVVIIMAVLCFGDWFGFYGILLAIPCTAVARVVTSSLLRAYRNSHFFLSIPR